MGEDGIVEHLQRIFGVESQIPMSVPKTKPRHQGERSLIVDVLAQAIEESQDPQSQDKRREARAWLLDEPGFTAREACDYLGIDYETMVRVMRGKWAEGERNG